MVKIKKMHFKNILKNELHKNHWEVISTGSINEWWEDEHWELQWRYHGGCIIWIQFLIDPQDASRVWEITAQKKLGEDELILASLSMSKRKFNVKLKEFIGEIEKFRKNEDKNIR